jgi:hypothetical protein
MLQRIDIARNRYPYLIFKRIPIINHANTVLLPINYGFDFLLRRITACWDSQDSGAANVYADLRISLTQTTRQRNLQNQSYPIALISSPASAGVYYASAPSPVDNDAFSKVFVAAPREIHKTLNILYRNKEEISLSIEGATINSSSDPTLNHPSYVDIVLEGDNIPTNRN